jgi:hypothetical protein
LIGWFPGIVSYARRDESEFQVRYLYQSPEGKLAAISLLRPEYYRTMVARLYLFRGQAVEPLDSTWLVASRPVRQTQGGEARLIEDMRRFHSWPEAAAFLAEHSDEGYEVMGQDPTQSCVPLEALEAFRQVYPTLDVDQGPALAPKVRIFEVLSERGPGPRS